MIRSVIWKVGLIVAVLLIFAVALIPTKNNPEPIRRGLDLKGGTHLVMRVNLGDASRLEVDQAMEMLKTQAGKNQLPTPASRRTCSSGSIVGGATSGSGAAASVSAPRAN